MATKCPSRAKCYVWRGTCLYCAVWLCEFDSNNTHTHTHIYRDQQHFRTTSPTSSANSRARASRSCSCCSFNSNAAPPYYVWMCVCVRFVRPDTRVNNFRSLSHFDRNSVDRKIRFFRIVSIRWMAWPHSRRKFAPAVWLVSRQNGATNFVPYTFFIFVWPVWLAECVSVLSVSLTSLTHRTHTLSHIVSHPCVADVFVLVCVCSP